MMGQTSIGWTATRLDDGTVLPGYTFNPWIGCTKVSTGCAHCYAERENERYHWVENWGKGSPRRLTSAVNWAKPAQWAKAAVEAGVRRRVFCLSLGDFLDSEVSADWKASLYFLIDDLEQKYHSLDWLLLTKRPEQLNPTAGFSIPAEWRRDPPSYVRIGVTVEEQRYLSRVTELLTWWKGNNFVSFEPALGPLDLGDLGMYIEWLIAGAESGPNYRYTLPDIFRSIRYQCTEEWKIPFFLKQMWIGRQLVKEPFLDGRQWLEFPK